MSFVYVCNNTAMIVLCPSIAQLVFTMPSVCEEPYEPYVRSDGCSPRQWNPIPAPSLRPTRSTMTASSSRTRAEAPSEEQERCRTCMPSECESQSEWRTILTVSLSCSACGLLDPGVLPAISQRLTVVTSGKPIQFRYFSVAAWMDTASCMLRPRGARTIRLMEDGPERSGGLCSPPR